MDMEVIMENGQNNTMRNESAIDLTILIDDLWRGFKKFYWLFLLLISVCSTAFYFWAQKSYVPVYEAYSSFVVNTNSAYEYSNTYYNRTTADQLSRTFPYILTSGVLNQVVAEKLGMESVPAEISAEAMEDTALFTIKVRAKEPQLAYDVMRAAITSYPEVAEYIIGSTKLIQMDESGVPQEPANPPDFLRKAAKGSVAGMVLSMLLLLLYALTRNTVRREEDLKAWSNIQCFGSVPKVRFKKRSTKAGQMPLMDQRGAAGMLGETFRMLRLRLMSETEKHGVKRILVTSAVPGEGKTTVAANFAIALAKKGKKVVLVDGDLRNPSVASVMGLEEPQQGLVEVLRGEADAAGVLCTYNDTSLKILPGSTPEASPTGLLGNRRMGRMMEALSRDADYVIVDAPPCTVVSDASLLTRYTEGTVLVVRQDYAQISRITAGIENMAETGVKILGYVLNNTEAGIMGYGYGYGYGYGRRRYGYRYGEKDE